MKVELRYKRCAYCLVGFLVGPAVAWLCWLEVRNELLLRWQGLKALASVTAWREMTTRYEGKSYELQYEFVANGWDGRFCRCDPAALGRGGLWSPIAEESWNKSRQTQTIGVLYLITDPRVNRPIDSSGHTLGDPIAGLAVGIGLALASAGALVVAAYQYLYRDKLMAGQVSRQFLLFRLHRRTIQDSRFDRRTALLERIGDVNNPDTPHALVSLELFFKGNDDPGSIGCNLPNPVQPSEFYRLLKGLRERRDVHDILIEVTQLEDPNEWPFSDTIWFITRAELAAVKSWFPEDISPDDIVEGFPSNVESYNVPEGFKAIGAWYD